MGVPIVYRIVEDRADVPVHADLCIESLDQVEISVSVMRVSAFIEGLRCAVVGSDSFCEDGFNPSLQHDRRSCHSRRLLP